MRQENCVASLLQHRWTCILICCGMDCQGGAPDSLGTALHAAAALPFMHSSSSWQATESPSVSEVAHHTEILLHNVLQYHKTHTHTHTHERLATVCQYVCWPHERSAFTWQWEILRLSWEVILSLSVFCAAGASGLLSVKSSVNVSLSERSRSQALRS